MLNQYESAKGDFEYPTISFVDENGLVYFMENSLYEFVDLGLPSGTLWATTNVGASKPEDFGLYFAWGETQGYSGITDTKKFNWSDYKLCDGNPFAINKYNFNSSYGAVDNLTTLEQVDDAAYQSDNICRIPTFDNIKELTANTTSVWETLNGINGRRFTSKTNSNSIFIPANGQYSDGVLNYNNSYGCIWSNTLSSSNSRNACVLGFYSAYVEVGDYGRCNGYTIRPVKL